jgi:hypothetical protein
MKVFSNNRKSCDFPANVIQYCVWRYMEKKDTVCGKARLESMSSLCNVQCAGCKVHCAMCKVHGALCNVHTLEVPYQPVNFDLIASFLFLPL